MKKSHSNSIGIKILSLVLVLAFGATAFVVGPSMFANAANSIPNDAVNAVKAGGNTAKAAPDSAAAGSGEKITIQKFEIDTKTIVVGEKPVVTFTAEITGALGEKDAKVVDGADTFIGYMNDKGINGDKTAGDGTYTLKLGMSHSKEEDVFYHAEAKGVKSEDAKIGYYIPLTDEECKAMDDSDNRIKECMRSDDFDQMSVSDRKEVMEDLLYQMADDGEIKRDSIKYDEENKHFTFEYACSVYGGVHITPRDENKNSAGSDINTGDLGINTAGADNDDLKIEEISSPFAAADKEAKLSSNKYSTGSSNNVFDPKGLSAPAISQNNIQNKEAGSTTVGANGTYRAIILNAFANRSIRRDFYNNLKTEWNSMGITTTVDVDVTVDDMKALTSYDTITMAMHGMVYDGSPAFCINQVPTSTTDNRYSYELRTRHSIARDTLQDTDTDGGFKRVVDEYVIFPLFFTDNYSSTAFENKLLFSESCMFFGTDNISTIPDYSMGDAFVDCGVGGLIGFHNSVDSVYGRRMMKLVCELCYQGKSLDYAFTLAKFVLGVNDGKRIKNSDSEGAYPIMYPADGNFYLRNSTQIKYSKTISLNTSTNVSIDVTGNNAKGWEIFKFVPTSNMKIEFYSTGTQDTFGILFDSDFEVVDYSDDASDYNSNFKITYNLEANKAYYFMCYLYYFAIDNMYIVDDFSVMLKGTPSAAKSISNCDISINPTSYIFDNTEKTPTVTVKDGSTTLTKDTHYTVTYSNNVNVGEGKAIITGKGNYTGSVEKKFTIAYDTISLNSSKSVTLSSTTAMKYYKFVPTKNMKVEFYSTGSLDTMGYLYNSSLTELTKNDDESGSSDRNFKITYDLTANTTYIFACKLYSGSGSFTIYLKDASQKSIKNCTIDISPTSYIFDNTSKYPTVTVKDGSKTLTLNTDYTVTYSSNIAVGEGKATVYGKGDYNDSVVKTFSIVYDTISLNSSKSVTISTARTKKYFKFVPTKNMTVEFYSTGTVDTVGYIYSPNDLGTPIVMDDSSGENSNFKFTYNLTANTTYLFTCAVYASYTGSFTVYLKESVTQKSINNCTVDISPTSYIFDNTAKTPTVTVKDGSTTLTKDTHYTVTYSNNVNVGEGKATITGKGNYTGSVEKKFTIAYDTIALNSSKNIAVAATGVMKYYKFVPTKNMKIEFYSEGSVDTVGYLYNSSLTQLTTNDDINGASNRNFKITYDLTANTTYVFGCKIYGSGTGSYTVYLKEVGLKSINNCTVSISPTSFSFDNTDKTPTVTVKDGSTTLTKGIDYTVTYSNNRSVGEGKAIITGIGNYTGSVEKKFTIAYDAIFTDIAQSVTVSSSDVMKYYKFVPTKNMTIEFYSVGSLDTVGYLYNSSLTQLASNDDIDGASNRNFKITYNLTANTTYIFACKLYNGTGTFTVYLKNVAQKSINDCTVTLSPTSYIFDNTAKTPAVTVKDGTKTLSNNTDYTVTYQNNKNVGTGKAVVTGKGEYKDSVTKTFTIAYDTISQSSAKTVNITTAGTMKYYKFVPSFDFNMQFYSTGDQNTYGYVYDSNMNVLASDDNSGSGNNFVVSYSVKANTTYVLGCKLNAANATGSFSICVENAAIKQKPSLSVENKNNGLHVQWSALNGATGYKVFYKTSSAPWSSTIVNGTSFDFQTGTPGYMYYFQILPIFGSSNGTYSNVVSCTYVRNTTLQSTAYNSNGSVTVGWAVAPGANGYAIAKKRSTDKSYTYYYTSATSFNDKNVVGGALYYYQIRPYYTNGKSAAYSDWSNTKTITTLFRPTVTNMNATAARLNINWNSIKGAQGYKVAFKRSYDSAWNFRTTTSRYYNVPNPTRGATYYVQVCAISGNLAGQYSAVNSIKIP